MKGSPNPRPGRSRKPSSRSSGPSEARQPPIERILLVGFMGSGKTRVGQALAKALGWTFRDFDQEIGARIGLPIPAIFREHGEGFFREIEERIGAELLQGTNVVLASGGGWPAAIGRMEGLGPSTFSIWLQISAEEALERVRKEGPTRPLLAGPDPLSRASALLEEREPFYGKAHAALSSAGTRPEELAKRIEQLINETGREIRRPPPPYK